MIVSGLLTIFILINGAYEPWDLCIGETCNTYGLCQKPFSGCTIPMLHTIILPTYNSCTLHHEVLHAQGLNHAEIYTSLESTFCDHAKGHGSR